MKALLAALGLALAGAAGAQTVSLGGSLGDKALLVIDGTPRTLAVGATVQGVRLLAVGGGEAVVEIAGRRATLALGGAQVDLGRAPSAGGGTQIVLTAQGGGHFIGDGAINGRGVRFLVDTGATNVSLSQAEARRIGLDLSKAQRGLSNTANGVVATLRLQLASVRVGDVTLYGVDATVVPAAMDHVLLGNSFLSRFQMRRENDTLTLDRRY